MVSPSKSSTSTKLPRGRGLMAEAAGLIVVVSTSDAALIPRQAAYLTLANAEYFRDLGKDAA